jgi:pyrroline-5-carboxylate reductase
MQVGLIGAGNMARALARGWGEPVLCTDSGSGRAQALADELGGEALASNAELAQRADLIVLCHKPHQLEAVAAEAAGSADLVVSVLARTPLEDVVRAYPGADVIRAMPNTPVEVRRGVTSWAPAEGIDPDRERAVRELFERVGIVIDVDERTMDVANAISGVGPAYLAVIVEAWAEAAVRRGIKAETAVRLATEALAGTAELLAARGGDTLAVRREVTSPGGVTARGLAALERGGLRATMDDAMDAVLSA